MMLTWLFGFFAVGLMFVCAWLFDQLRQSDIRNAELLAQLMTAQSQRDVAGGKLDTKETELRITGNVLRAVDGQLRDYVSARTVMLEIYRNPN